MRMRIRKSNVFFLPLLLAFAFLTSGCAAGLSGAAGPVTGGLYTDVKKPHPATTADVAQTPVDTPSRVGRATSESFLSLVAIGDASIEAAMEDGNITEVHHVDLETTSILGVYSTYTVVVYGE